MGQAQTAQTTQTTPTQQTTTQPNPQNKGYEFVQNNNQQQNNTSNPYQYNNNPYNNPQQINTQPKYKATITYSMLIDAFKTFSIDGKYLNQARFNDTIEKLFSRIDIPSMHYTFLSERIYTLLDESRDGKISEDEYVNGMKNVIMNKEFRLKCKQS